MRRRWQLSADSRAWSSGTWSDNAGARILRVVHGRETGDLAKLDRYQITYSRA